MKNLIKELKDGLFTYQEASSGWLVKIKTPGDLLKGAANVRDAGIKKFDTFSPFPIHGMDHAMGIKRSWLPLITLVMGLAGAVLGIVGMGYIMAIEWPIVIGGKPFFSWPALIPITFEMTILLAGLSTVAGVIIMGKLYKPKRTPLSDSITSDGYAIWIGDSLKEDEVKNLFNDMSVEVSVIEPTNN